MCPYLISDPIKMSMHPLLKKLEGGDLRSIGRSEEVVSDVLKSPDLFGILIMGIDVDDPCVCMRASDAIEKVSLKHPEYLRPHKKYLIEQLAKSKQKEVRWHLAQIVTRLDLNGEEERAIVDILMPWFKDGSSIVKTFAMQALAGIAVNNSKLRPAILKKLKELTATGTPAMRARGRKLLEELEGL